MIVIGYKRYNVQFDSLFNTFTLNALGHNKLLFIFA